MSEKHEPSPNFSATGKDRRRFIKSAVGGVASLPLISAGAAAQDSIKAEYDTIVIGGGFAGVTAARETSMRGLNTLLLEARPRLGGRTLTLDLGDHHLDVGGTWIGWSQPHVWAEIMRYGLPIEESAAAAANLAVWMEQGKRVEGPYDDYAVLFQRATDAFFAPAREALPRPFDPLFAKGNEKLDAMNAVEAIEALKTTAVERDLALSLAAVSAHAKPETSSYLDQLRWFALGDFDVWNMFDNTARYRVRGGTKTLLDRIHEDSNTDTRFSTPIASIKQNDDWVTVTSKDGENFRARSAIVAVPLNCVADINFEPGIANAKLRVSRARHTGSGTKLYAKIKKKPLFVGHGKHDMPLCFLWTEYDDADSQVLVGFGASEEYLDVNDGDAVVSAIHDYLPEAEVEDVFAYNWNVDPYAKGTWCMYRPNVLTQDFEKLQQAEGRVHFAGSDIANGWRGFIDGAIESGLSTGRQVSDRVKSKA
jgi:monoamine oxidase